MVVLAASALVARIDEWQTKYEKHDNDHFFVAYSFQWSLLLFLIGKQKNFPDIGCAGHVIKTN